MNTRSEIEEIVNRETRAWDTQEILSRVVDQLSESSGVPRFFV